MARLQLAPAAVLLAACAAMSAVAAPAAPGPASGGALSFPFPPLPAGLRVGQSTPPAWPLSCNTTYLQWDSWRSWQDYTRKNAQCVQQGKDCIQSGQGNKDCTGFTCTAGGPDMLSTCAIATDTPCTVSAGNTAPVDPNVPVYSLQYDLCLPRNMAPGAGCWEDAVPGLEAYWRYALCGPGLYTSPDCKVSVSCSFNHQMPWDMTPIIWGTLAAAAVLGGGGFILWRRSRAAQAAGDDYLGLGGEDEEDEAARAREEAAVGEPTPVNAGAGGGAGASHGRAGGATYAAPDPSGLEDDPSVGHGRGGAGGGAGAQEGRSLLL